MVFDYPSPRRPHRFPARAGTGTRAASRQAGPGRAPARWPGQPASAPAGAEDPIAIIGMSCRYPGGVASPEDLWDLVERGGDAISAFPSDRGWDTDGLYDPDPDRPGKTYSTTAVSSTAPRTSTRRSSGSHHGKRWRWTPSSACCWRSLGADGKGGLDPAALRGSRTGAFIGASYHDYAAAGTGAGGSEGHLVTGTLSSLLSGRLAYTFGFEGPAVTLDTACSSSLVAMHLACQALRTGESSLALAGGVSIMATPARSSASGGSGRWPLTAAARPTRTRPTGSPWPKAPGCCCSSGCPTPSATGTGCWRHPRQRGQLRRRVQRADRAERPVPAARHRPGAGQRGRQPGRGRRRRRPRHRDPLGDPIEAHALLATYGQDRPAGTRCCSARSSRTSATPRWLPAWPA